MTLLQRATTTLAWAPLCLSMALSPAWGQVPANPDPAAARAGVYALETSHTRVAFGVSHMGFTTWYGDFAGVTGQLNLQPPSPAATRLDITIPAASISTTNAKVDAALKGPDWFDAERYPVITFHATRVTPTGPRTADVAGDLTFHGVTRPLVLHASFNGAGVNPVRNAYTVGFEVTGALRRSDFAVARSIPMIGDEVRLFISAAFERQVAATAP